MASPIAEPLSGVLWQETLRGGSSWSHILKRGTALRIVDLEGNANVPALFYNADLLHERYNMPDTLKGQHTAHLTHPFTLHSDMGRILCSITADSVGWHDPIGGRSNGNLVKTLYGALSYQEARNEFHRNTQDNFLIELQKYGLNRRDLVANVNFFSKVRVDMDGSMHYVPGNSRAGDYVELRAEMNVLVILDTCQHALDPVPLYEPKPVEIVVRRVPAPDAHDACRKFRPENERAFVTTERFFL